MNFENIANNLSKRGFKVSTFETNEEACDYLNREIDNTTVGFGGSMTLKELELFDEKLGVLLPTLQDEDLLIITADHGNDPTYTGTDHTREKVPFLAWSPSMNEGGKLKEQDTFAVVGATIADNFGVAMPEGTIGTSILDQLR